MPCRTLDLGNGATAIVCTRGQQRPRCSVVGCRGDGTKLCDFPLGGAKTGKTCDRPVCNAHATSVGKNRDYCDVHAKLSAGKP